MRKRPADRIVVEQTRELEAVNRLFRAAGFARERPERPAGCYLVAWIGERAIGALALENRVDAALMRCLSVDATMRGQGVAGALIGAAREAARARGARTLYAFAPGDILRGFGFVAAAVEEMALALDGTTEIEEFRADPERFAGLGAWRVDLSRDGIIDR